MKCRRISWSTSSTNAGWLPWQPARRRKTSGDAQTRAGQPARAGTACCIPGERAARGGFNGQQASAWVGRHVGSAHRLTFSSSSRCPASRPARLRSKGKSADGHPMRGWWNDENLRSLRTTSTSGRTVSRTVEKVTRFCEVITQLESLRSQVIADLKQGDNFRLQSKLQLDDAIQCLKFCRTHDITASAKVIRLPETRTRTPSSEYRILEDHETEDRNGWTELKVGSAQIRPAPGTLLIDCGLWPGDVEA